MTFDQLHEFGSPEATYEHLRFVLVNPVVGDLRPRNKSRSLSALAEVGEHSHRRSQRLPPPVAPPSRRVVTHLTAPVYPTGWYVCRFSGAESQSQELVATG